MLEAVLLAGGQLNRVLVVLGVASPLLERLDLDLAKPGRRPVESSDRGLMGAEPHRRIRRRHVR